MVSKVCEKFFWALFELKSPCLPLILSKERGLHKLKSFLWFKKFIYRTVQILPPSSWAGAWCVIIIIVFIIRWLTFVHRMILHFETAPSLSRSWESLDHNLHKMHLLSQFGLRINNSIACLCKINNWSHNFRSSYNLVVKSILCFNSALVISQNQFVLWNTHKVFNLIQVYILLRHQYWSNIPNSFLGYLDLY